MRLRLPGALPQVGVIAAVVGFLLLGLAWSLGNPLYAAPDEPDHVARAAAVVQGQWVGVRTTAADGRPVGYVTAPWGVESPTARHLCFAHHPRRSAHCQRLHPQSARLVRTTSGAAAYFPPYYAVVGLPSLPWPSPTGVYLMRVLSLLGCALLFASAATSIARTGSPLLALGLLAGTTPMVLYMSSVVNPNSLEIVAGLAVWCAAIAFLHSTTAGTVEGDDRATGRFVRQVGVAGTVMMLMRPTSPLWFALTIAVVAAVAGWPQVRLLARRRDVRVWAGVLVTAAAVNLAWYQVLHPLPPGKPHRTSFIHALGALARRWPWRYEQLVGVFGWLDTHAPLVTFVVWWLLVGGLALAGLVLGSRRWRFGLVAAAVLTAAVPPLIEAAEAHAYGLIWQGRYYLPFAVGVPLVAAAAAARSVRRERARTALVVAAPAVATAQVCAFAVNQLRYQHGVGHGGGLFSGAWLPPGGAVPVVVLAVLGALLLVAGAVAIGFVDKTAAQDEVAPRAMASW